MYRNILCYITCIFIAIALGLLNNSNKSEYWAILRSNWIIILSGIVFQLLIVIAFTKNQLTIDCISAVSGFMLKLKDAAMEGTKFVFGYLGGEQLPFELKPGTSSFVFAFQALPTIIVVSVVSAILTYFKIIPYLSKLCGSIFKFIFKIKDSIGMVAISKIFLGQLEAPLLIKSQLDYLKQLDIFIILSLAFSTSSASVMPMYSEVLYNVCPNAMNHLIISNVINVISTLIICCIIIPSRDNDNLNTFTIPTKTYNNLADAISRGLSDGTYAWWAIVGSLIGMVALVYLMNFILSYLPNINKEPITLQRIVAYIAYPISWLLNINNNDILQFSQVLGSKIVVNEAVAFFDLAKANLSSDSTVKAIYALNNFGNFACIGITANGMLALAPKQQYITKLVGRSFVAGFIATILTTAIIGIFL